MKTIEQLSSIVTILEHNIDCLLIRVHSCQQFIQKLLKVVGQTSLSQQKYSSFKTIRSNGLSIYNNGDENNSERKSMPDMIQLGNTIQKTQEKYNHQHKPSSIKDFLIIGSNKDTKTKQIDSGSFALIKNAILVNNHQIQNMQENFENYKNKTETRFNKFDEAINLLTKVTALIQQKLDTFLNLHVSNRKMKSSRKQKTPSKSSRLMVNYY